MASTRSSSMPRTAHSSAWCIPTATPRQVTPSGATARGAVGRGRAGDNACRTSRLGGMGKRARRRARVAFSHQGRRRYRGGNRRGRELMALLQIAEPDAPPAPHQHRLAVGIDLGTTNSLVATVRHGIPVVLPDAEGRPLLPSIVCYADRGVEVGYPAQDVLVVDPQNTIVSV